MYTSHIIGPQPSQVRQIFAEIVMLRSQGKHSSKGKYFFYL